MNEELSRWGAMLRCERVERRSDQVLCGNAREVKLTATSVDTQIRPLIDT
jgi:hypothetical protein